MIPCSTTFLVVQKFVHRIGLILLADEKTESSPSSEPTTDDDSSDEPWKHFTFICSIELIDKVQAIAHKEGFTIRAFMEYMMRQGIAQYEAKHGKARKIKVKAVKDVM